MIADFKAAGDQSGCIALRSATTPEITGAAMDVPARISNPPALELESGDVAASMLTPGAPMSGCIAKKMITENLMG